MKKEFRAVLCASLAATACVNAQEKKLPNIVYILADDLGYGDLSCYGQTRFKTPNIDRLASEGMIFTRHYCGCTVSAPSRSSLMTGLHTGHTPIRGNRSWQPEGNWPLPAGTYTIGKMLQSAGYITGAFGKWGLGYIDSDGSPDKQGFNEFYGFNCQTLAHNYYPDHLWHNREKILLPENDNGGKGAYSADLIHNAAIDFLEKNKDRQFFLFYPTTIPHAELFAKEEYMKKFRGKFDPEKSFKGTDSGPEFRKGPYGSQPEAHAAYAAMVTNLDDNIGKLLEKLRLLGIDKNTIIIFASDNGPHLEAGADPDFFDSNGALRGYKRDMYEGGIRTPMIVRWPGMVKAGSKSDHVSAFWDIMPTLGEITGSKVPADIDGISFVPVLTGKKVQKQHDYLYWEFHEQGGKTAVISGKWKAIRLNIDKPSGAVTELYDLDADPSETKNIATANPEIVKKMEAIMKSSHVPSADFPFNSEKSKQ